MQRSDPAKSTPSPRNQQNKVPRRHPSLRNLKTPQRRPSCNNNNSPKRNLQYNKDYVSPYSYRSIRTNRNKHSPRDYQHESPCASKFQGSTPNINSKVPKSISSWVSVPNVSHKPTRHQISPRDRINSTALKRNQAYSCSSLNKHVDPSNQMRNSVSGRNSRESVAKLRHSSPTLSSKKSLTKPPMRFGK